jgi:hypothetical protein
MNHPLDLFLHFQDVLLGISQLLLYLFDEFPLTINELLFD